MTTMLTAECEECGHEELVTQTPATREEPEDVDRDTCSACGGNLDFECAEPVDEEELRYEAYL